MPINFQFTKAIKFDARGRVALVGPPGSGKSYTMLRLARALAGPKGRIAAVDTEHGSLSKYADLFDFDVIELDSYSPENFMGALDAAEKARYDVFCGDSLSHFWMGKDGALEFVDAAAKRARNDFEGWKQFRPHERAMVDRMVASPCHVIVTMRTKTEYLDEVDERTGKKKRVKVGLQPVQREGLEYEFDLVGYMDETNTFVVDKTRCPGYSLKAYTKPGVKEFQPFVDWLKGEKRTESAIVPAPAVPVTPIAIVPTPTSPAAAGAAEVPDGLQVLFASIRNSQTAIAVFAQMQGALLDTYPKEQALAIYAKALNSEGVEYANQFTSTAPARRAAAILYEALRTAPQQQMAGAA